MHETEDDLVGLQALLDRSIAASGPHLKSMFNQRMTASEVATELPGILEVHFATVTPSGAPFVAPIDGLFYRGQFWIGIPSAAARRSFVHRERRVSISYTRGDSFCVIVHGLAVEVGDGDPLAAEYAAHSDDQYVKLYGEKWLDWAAQQREDGNAGDLWRIAARRMFIKR